MTALVPRDNVDLIALAVLVGVGAGLGAVGFRWLVFGATWLVTGHRQFGQAGHVASLHLPALGFWFMLAAPVVGGLVYGPLIQRFAPEARGHGVPEVMFAVAREGGRIRPQVTVVKAFASALCIGSGGSVGREGPIVQIGSALASSLGQLLKMPPARLRLLVACGAAGGISATFNAPVTGILFSFELILREFSLEALLPVVIASGLADLIGRAFFGSAPVFNGMPHVPAISTPGGYLLVIALGIAAAFVGVGFKTILYWMEDACDRVWNGRPEWCRPAVGGVLLGAMLLALPQLYGVGYPVIGDAANGSYVLWFLVLLMLGKMIAASLTIGIGGSGGVFAPSLFVGMTGGTAFGIAVSHIFGPATGPPATYGLIAMGAVFAASTQTRLTAMASVLEMTRVYTVALPVILAVLLATAVSRRLTYGTIYTTKLLRRGVDINKPALAPVIAVAAATAVEPGDG